MQSNHPSDPSRRRALQCMALGGTVFMLSGGVLVPVDLATAAEPATDSGSPLFVQISDTHIGFNKEANPDVAGTLRQTIALVNAMPVRPALALHTGDITHLSKPEEFDLAAQLLTELQVPELHAVPGEHDVADGPGGEYFKRYGSVSGQRGYYSFDRSGVHFVALVNVLNFKPNGLGALGADQIEWLKKDLAGLSSSTPVVVFAHMPLWTIHEPWGWGTGDAGEAFKLLSRFGSVAVLNGHIHQVVTKVEGNLTFHTALSTAFPQPAAGVGAGPGPLAVPRDRLPTMLGMTTVRVAALPSQLVMTDVTLAAGSRQDAGHAQAAPPVELKSFAFLPAALTVRAGTTVTWKNLDEEPHTVVDVDGSFRSPALDQGDSYRHTFDKAGSYTVFCSIHPHMKATVTVQ